MVAASCSASGLEQSKAKTMSSNASTLFCRQTFFRCRQKAQFKETAECPSLNVMETASGEEGRLGNTRRTGCHYCPVPEHHSFIAEEASICQIIS
jgi:hypothetical protein